MFVVNSVVSIHFCECGGVVEAAYFLNEGMIAPVSAGEEGEEPGSCGLHGGLSIVRTEEEFDDICGLALLVPCHEFHSSIPDRPDPLWDHHLASCYRDSSGDSSLVTFKAIGNADEAQSSSQLLVVGVALAVELLELFNSSRCLFKFRDVVFSLLVDCGGEAEGGGADGGVDGWVKHKDCFG